ncbi:MAG: hypothetical protein ACFCD0_21270 [Gemmataceae bacterium]
MSSGTIVCPYCNATISSSEITPGSSKVVCSSCGETIPNVSWEDVISSAGAPQGSSDPGNAGVQATPASSTLLRTPDPVKWSNLRTAIVVLGIMAIMAGVGLGYALWTQDSRRKNDYPEQLTNRDYEPVKPVPPASLPGLANLPGDCVVLAGFHIGELLAEEDGQDMIKDLQRQLPMLDLETFETWTGLKITDIHSVALGVTQKGGLRLIAIVQTRGGYNINPIKKELTGIPGVNYKKKPAFQLPNNAGLLWCINAKSMAILFQPGAEVEDLKTIRDNPFSLIDDFPEGVQTALKKRLNPTAFAWVVARPEAAKGLIAVGALTNQLNEQNANALRKMEVATGSLRLHKGLTLEANFKGDSLESTQVIEKLFPPSGNGPKLARDYKIIGPTTATDEEAKQDPWVTLQLRMELNKGAGIITAIREALRK